MSENNIVERVAAFNAASKAARIGTITQHQAPKPPIPEGVKSFAEILKEQTGLRFSAHAQQRIDQRHITINTTEMARLDKAVTDVQAKGSKDALVLLDNKAFLISVANKTVVTALNDAEKAGKVFTNIDSAVVA